MADLSLPSVTICAATSVNLQATLAALDTSQAQVDAAQCLLFTDRSDMVLKPGVRAIPIPRLTSSRDYSHFLLNRLADHIRTEHCLIVQWDGFVLDAEKWTDEFLDYDYVGAPWPQFSDGNDVGNGGFSLRSRRLIEACRDPAFISGHPEDVAICRINRRMLEREHGIRFAPLALAQQFSVERSGFIGSSFGFHGVFNLIPALGGARFWDSYQTLDDRQSVFVDIAKILRQLRHGPHSIARRGRLIGDFLRNRAGLRRRA